ncbi:MAG TPA: glucosaminidase domain-containing protein [Anaerolineales bacterium]
MADPKYVQDFIAEMTPYAVAVGDQFGIDPVTIITQAAVETGWGREVAGNNYFGVKSHGRPGGQNITTHEEVGGKRVRTTDNFRTYGSLGESVADYGKFLSENPRYTEALKLTGPEELQGIAKAGYATDSNYADLTRNVAGMVKRNIRPLPPGSLPEVASLQDTRRPTQPPAVPPRRPDGDSRLHPFDAATNTPRPNADGSVSTEVTRTVQLPDGNAVNVPSLWWGQGSSVRDFGSMSDDQLADFAMRYEQQSGNAFPRYGGIPEAERAAIARSNAGGGTKGPITYPGSLVAQTFNRLPKPGGNAGDSIAMSPVQGGRQQAPMFDATYDERVGSMRQTRQPIDSQGMATGSSRPPAPVPASPFDRVTARLNALPPQARLPELPPPRTQVSASDMARGRNGWETVASIPSTPAPQQFSASDMARGRSGVPPVADRLAPGVPAMPEIPGAPRTRMASAAPFPMPRPSFMPQVGSALSVRPMPPMPVPRPMMQQAPQQRRAPVPMPLAMRPQQQRAPLRITVQRDQPQQQARPQSRTPQGFTDTGNGRLISDSTGGIYYSRHLK